MKRTNASLLILISLLMVSCVNSKDLLDAKISNQIPEDAKTMILELDQPDEEAYKEISRMLIRRGDRIETDDEYLTITTEGIDVGQSTQSRYTLYIEDGKLFGRADWRPGTAAHAMATSLSGVNMETNWETADWSTGRPKRAYASLVSFMSDIPHKTYNFE